jgi:hypothetical protein
MRPEFTIVFIGFLTHRFLKAAISKRTFTAMLKNFENLQQKYTRSDKSENLICLTVNVTYGLSSRINLN